MNNKIRIALSASTALLLAGCAWFWPEPKNPMTFFITSAGPGKGADLGGLAGADAHCQKLAGAVGAGGRTWRAYLSTSGAGAVNARDRIGRGPWQNAKGLIVARSVDDLHSANNQLNKQNSLDEKGQVVPGRGDPVNQHDILTGSGPDGRAIAGKDLTCNDWTSSGTGAAMVGHHDRIGLRDDEPSRSWNRRIPRAAVLWTRFARAAAQGSSTALPPIRA